MNKIEQEIKQIIDSHKEKMKLLNDYRNLFDNFQGEVGQSIFFERIKCAIVVVIRFEEKNTCDSEVCKECQFCSDGMSIIHLHTYIFEENKLQQITEQIEDGESLIYWTPEKEQQELNKKIKEKTDQLGYIPEWLKNNLDTN